MSKKIWTKDSIIEAFEKYKSEGNDIRSSAMQKNYNTLFKGILRNFGSYKVFVEFLGIDYKSISSKRARWSEREILDEFKNFEKTETDLSPSNIKNKRNDLYIQISRKFGSYGIFIESLGYDYSDIRTLTYWSDDIIVDEIKSRYAKGLPISDKCLEKDYPKLRRAAINHFGSLRNAVNACGIDYEEIAEFTFWDDAKIKQEFLKLYEDANVNCLDDIRSINRGLDHAIRKYKGGYANYCKELGLDISKVQSEVYEWKEEDLISVLLEMRASGEKLNVMSVQERFPSVTKVATKYFGSYAKALESIGESLEDHADDRVLMSMKGKEFERKVRDMFVVLGKTYRYQYREFAGIIPDFYDEQNKTIIDTKLSSWSVFNCDTVRKYTPYCNALKIIYLRGGDLSHGFENIEMVNIDSYFEELRLMGREDIIEGFLDLRNNLNIAEKAS